VNNEGAVNNPVPTNRSRSLDVRTERWKRDLKFLFRQTRVLILLLRHPSVPWHAKLIAACTLGYLLSPIQLIPTFIPIVGQLDDLAVLFLGMKFLRMLAPDVVLADCEEKVSGRVLKSEESQPRPCRWNGTWQLGARS